MCADSKLLLSLVPKVSEPVPVWWTRVWKGYGWLVEFGFEVHRGEEAEGAVEPRSVVEDFDVFEDSEASLGACGKGARGEEFGFESAPEALHVSVVVAVGPAAHADFAVVLPQDLTVLRAGILDAAVAVMKNTAWPSAPGHGLA